jgi:hypothetical protein
MPKGENSRPNNVSTELYQLIIAELTLQPDKQLVNIRGMGRGLWVTESHALCWSTGKFYERVQLDWIEREPNTVPLSIWSDILRRILSERKSFALKRIKSLETKVGSVQNILEALEKNQPKELLAALRRSANLGENIASFGRTDTDDPAVRTTGRS